jgi:hypothetical protein
MAIAGWKTHAMLLRYLGNPEDRMRSAFSKMDAKYEKSDNRQPPIDKSKISKSNPYFRLNEKGVIFGRASITA